jgi:NAD(P)-dependent dehydrogenase (short-subunit alcohol dehydrogenase family)
VNGAVVITGASRGLGRALAEHLSGLGHDLVLCARSMEALDEVARGLRSRNGTQVVAVQADVTSLDDISEVAAVAMRSFERIAGVVNNAGVLGPLGRLSASQSAQWSEAITTNLCSVAHVTAAFLPAMIERGSGSVITLSGAGVGGPQVGTHMSAYAVSKFGVVGFTEAMARELADTGIRVNAIAPGAVATEFMSGVIDEGPNVTGAALYESTVKSFTNPVSMEPYLELAAYLLNDRSSWLTGCLLSARWDSVERLEAARDKIVAGSLFRLRRIDDDLFTQITTT